MGDAEMCVPKVGRWCLVAATLALILALGPGPARAGEGSAVRADAPLMEARTAEERACLAEASRVGIMITIWTGLRAQDTSYAEDYQRIVEDCRAGRYDSALDRRAVIWAALTLHKPHSS
jgi:hypothetical protein